MGESDEESRKKYFTLESLVNQVQASAEEVKAHLNQLLVVTIKGITTSLFSVRIRMFCYTIFVFPKNKLVKDYQKSGAQYFLQAWNQECKSCSTCSCTCNEY